MSFDFTLDVTDLNRYQQRLEDAAGQVSKAGQRNAAKWAKQGAKEAQRLVHVITGTLKASIHADGAFIRADAPYAGFEEFGTVHRPPHPYMRPAVAKIRKPFQAEQLQIGAGLLGSVTAARRAVAGAVPRGSTLGPGGGARAASQASVEQGGLP